MSFLNKNDKVIKVGSLVRLDPDVDEIGSAWLRLDTEYKVSAIIATKRAEYNECWFAEFQLEGQPVIETWYSAGYFELIEPKKL